MKKTRRGLTSLLGLAVVFAGPAWIAADAATAVEVVTPKGRADVVDRSSGPRSVEGSRVDAKHARRPTVTVDGRRYPATNPYLSQLARPGSVDWAYWRHRLSEQGLRRERTRVQVGSGRGRHQRQVPTPTSYPEQEATDATAANDSTTAAERLEDLGVGKATQATEVRGSLARGSARARLFRTREGNGTIPRATRLSTPASRPRVVVKSVIGDGTHGRKGDRRGDFDFYRVTAKTGQSIQVTTAGSRLDTMLFLYGPKGSVRAFNDDVGDSSHGELNYRVPTAGSYYVMVAGFTDRARPLASPFRGDSGRGAGDEGRYRVEASVRTLDRDYFSVELGSGDVLGGTLRGGALRAQVHRVDGARMVGSDQDASAAYPTQSPLPGGGSTFAYVAEQPGWYAVSVEEGEAAYRLLPETYRPGSETEPTGAVQKIFLDFDGARVNTNIFLGEGVRTLSPTSRFLTRWGLSAGDLDGVIDATVVEVEENIDQTLRDQGINPDLEVEVLNSRDDADPFGDDNVSRVVVGGTIAQSGLPTIGIAQSVDPGNFGHEETALVLLDDLSSPAGPGYSLNTYLKAGSDRVAFVGQAVGNVLSHEIGHMIGSFHTENANDRANLMDAGGTRPSLMYGVGPDRRGGTADDTDVDFGTDRHLADEGFLGSENTLNNSAWAFLPGTR